jgi:hypothetical protein
MDRANALWRQFDYDWLVRAKKVKEAGVQEGESMAESGVIYCRECGQQNPENNYKCSACDALLHARSTAQVAVTDDSTLGGLVPYKNAKALWSYYLGIFSLIPFIGIPLGIAALVLGLQGLKFAESHPEARGKVHAWVGIIVGGLFAALYLLVLLLPFILD